MALWLQVMIIWVLVAVTVNFLTRRMMAKYYIQSMNLRDEASSSSPYQRGFKDGALGVKMYYTILEKMPSSHWIDTNSTKKLNTREKLLETLTEEERANL